MTTKQKAQTKPKSAKPTKASKTTDAKPARSAKSDKKMSALDAAARVLTESKEPMSCLQLIEAMAAKGYWKSPGGMTPGATLSSAIQREINVKKGQSRFEKTAPGRFMARKSG
jgi:hypothetical protein